MKPGKVPPATKWETPLAALLLGVGLLLVYGPALRGEFIWDDDAYVTNNPLLTAADGWQRIWFSAHRQTQFFPLVFTTLRLEYALWGAAPFGYHLVNVLLHAANALLVGVVLRRLAMPGAWIAAALFAFHPVQVESVAWVTELKNTQSTLFYLLALLTWMRFLRAGPVPRWRFYCLTLWFYVLALLSKTTTCTLVAALLLIPWLQGERIGLRRLWQVVPFVILGLTAGLVSIWWESHLGNYQVEVGQSLSLLERTLIASRAVWFYVGKLVLPVNLAFSYPHWQMNVADLRNYIWLSACLVVAFVLWRWRQRIGRPPLAAILFFIATLSPLLGFIPLYTFRFSYVADHYQYVASIGLLALAAAGLSRLPRAVPAGLIAVLGFLTWKQAHIYQNQTALWQDTIAKNPGSWMAHNNLGTILKDRGESDRAMQHFLEAVRLKPDFAAARYNLGIVLFKRGQTAEAISQFREAVRLDPLDSRAFYNLGSGLDRMGQPAEAIPQYKEAIRLNPDYVEARINLGIVFSQLDRIDDALIQFQEAVRLGPGNAEARNNLGAVLRATGRLDAAIEQFREATRLDPQHALARGNLGAALLQQGQVADAIRELQEAVNLDPNNAQARSELNRAREMMGGTSNR